MVLENMASTKETPMLGKAVSQAGIVEEPANFPCQQAQHLQDSEDQHQSRDSLSSTDLSSSANESGQANKEVYSVFSKRVKVSVVVVTIFGSFFSPLSSFIYLPAITSIANSYGRPLSQLNLTVTAYQVMQALAPLFFGDLSDQIGRRPVYMLTFTIYIGANIGLALQENYVALLILRAIQSAGSSATVAIGSGVVADISTPAERGGYITAVQASIQIAPALAPVLGGLLTQYLGWRSTFWFLAIMAGVFVTLYVFFVPETGRRIVGNGSIKPTGLNMSVISRIQHPRHREKDVEDGSDTSSSISNNPKETPPKIPIPNIFAAIRILFEKDVGLLMFYTSLFVMANYAMLIPLQDIMRRRYSLTDLQVGLCYAPFAFGSICGSFLVGRLMNWNYARVAAQIGVSVDKKSGDDLRKFPIETARLELIWPFIFLAVATMGAWGWVVNSGVHLAVPLVISALNGFGTAGPVSISTTLLIDLYSMNPGRVSSAFNLIRGALSALGTAVVQYIIDAWGYGFTYLFLSLIIFSSSSSILVVRRWGPGWREERYQRVHGDSA